MSVRSAMESPSDAATSDVLRIVAAARRRVRTVAALRLIAIAVPAGVTAGAALVLAGWTPAGTPLVLGGVGAIGAAAWAAVHTPAATAVARMLDTRLGLRDRVAAAVQLQTTGGPIAALVARDAAARLADARMTEVFPFALGRGHAAALALAVASIAWLASSRVASEPVTRAGSATSAAAGDASSAHTSAGSRATSADSSGRASASTPATPTPQSRAQGRPGGAAQEAFARTGTTGAPQESQPPTAAAPRSSVSASGPPAQAANAPAAAGAGRRTGRGGAGQGPTGRGAITAGAGGTAPGRALASAPGADPASPAVTVSYRAARASAESALARDVIPPDYRDHVRAYFRALSASTTIPGGTR